MTELPGNHLSLAWHLQWTDEDQNWGKLGQAEREERAGQEAAWRVGAGRTVGGRGSALNVSRTATAILLLQNFLAAVLSFSLFKMR